MENAGITRFASSCSDYVAKASRKLREINRGQAVLQAVKQLRVWLKTTLRWNVNIPKALAMHSALTAALAAIKNQMPHQHHFLFDKSERI